jgi:membrane protein
MFVDRAREWAAGRDPASASGVALDAWRRYRDVDGPLQSALLSIYALVALVPAVLAMETYLDGHPAALANHLARNYALNDETAAVVRSVLVNSRSHELGSALLATASALFFGLGFGRVLQLVHARAWSVDLPRRALDQALYAGALIGTYGLILVLLLQLTELHAAPAWVAALLGLGWAALLALLFVLGPWLLLHRQVSRRDLVPGALLSAGGIVVLMVVSRYVIEPWVNLYSRDYGSFGVVLAIYFWIAFSSAVVVWSAALSPALADRRRLRANAPSRTAPERRRTT